MGSDKTLYASYRKVRKNVKKSSHINEFSQLNELLKNKSFKGCIKLLDLLLSSSHVICDQAKDMRQLVKDVIEIIYNGPLSLDPTDVEASELLSLINSPHIQALSDCYTEIALRNFNEPELAESAMYTMSGTYATLPSVASIRGSHLPLSAFNERNEDAAATNGMNAYSETHTHLDSRDHANVLQPTLTGGGFGPSFPLVEGTMKIVGFEKNYGEDLGITVVQQKYMTAQYGLVKELVVKRILTASRIDQQGLLHEGDVIREANGVPVDTPQALQRILRNARGTVTLKIIPGRQPQIPTSQLFLRAYFSYNPKTDNLIPCKEAGLPFSAGDVLQVLKQEDPYWWQARHYGYQQRAGLIPSTVLQERRRAFNQSAPTPEELRYKMVACGLARRRRKKVTINFRARDAEEYETKDLVLYEEVALISGFQRPVICLIGADGVGRRSLRDMVLRSNLERYGIAVQHTTRPRDPDLDDDGEFIVDTHANMEKDNFANKYLEFGEFEGHYYGTKFESVRKVVNSGRTCLLDCAIHSVNKIRNSEFMPYVVFLAAPSVSCMKAMYEYGMSMGFTHKWKRDENFRQTLEHSRYIEQNYRHLLDKTILCDNIESNFEQLTQTLNDLLIQPQWVPARWLY